MKTPDLGRVERQARGAGGWRRERDGHNADAAHDGGMWRGPTEGVRMKRLLAGSPPPRWSAGPRDALVEHS